MVGVLVLLTLASALSLNPTAEGDTANLQATASKDQIRQEQLQLSDATNRLQSLWDKSNAFMRRLRRERTGSDKHYNSVTAEWTAKATQAMAEAAALEKRLTSDVSAGKVAPAAAAQQIQQMAVKQEEQLKELERKQEEANPDPKKVLNEVKLTIKEIAPEGTLKSPTEMALVAPSQEKLKNMMKNEDLKVLEAKAVATVAAAAPPPATPAVVTSAPASPAVAAAAPAAAVAAAAAAAAPAVPAPAVAAPAIAAAAAASGAVAKQTIILNPSGDTIPMDPEKLAGGTPVLTANELKYKSIVSADLSTNPRLHRKVFKKIQDINRDANVRRLLLKNVIAEIPELEDQLKAKQKGL